jgi:hypothetical protein
MSHNKPAVTVHPPPLINTWLPQPKHREHDDDSATLAAASREAAEREAAFLRALSPPQMRQQAPPPLRGPALPDDFDAAEIDEQILGRGVAFDRDKLLTLGRQRFSELLEADKKVRSFQRVLFNDLTSWPSVVSSFAAVTPFRAAAVPRRTTAEALAGRGSDKESAAAISGFDDLWKLTGEPETVRNVVAFHDEFERLCFGQSLLQNIDSDGRVRSRLFVGGSGRKVALFDQWLSVLAGQHYKVKLTHPLWTLVSWIAGETPLPGPGKLAIEWIGVRAPSPAQIRLAESVVDGFVRGLRSWGLWEHVGANSRVSLDLAQLETWTKQLSKRYPAIARFHDEIESRFWRSVSTGFGSTYEQHRVSDEPACRAYLESEFARLLDQASLIAAQTIGAGCVARFDDWLLVEGKIKPSADKIANKLRAAFPGGNFQVEITQ